MFALFVRIHRHLVVYVFDLSFDFYTITMAMIEYYHLSCNQYICNFNCKQNKKEIDRLERKLDKLKLIANETDEIGAQIKQRA